MRRTIWKFPLEVAPSQVVRMPYGSTIISVQYQGDRLTAWALVDPENRHEAVDRLIEVYGTGHPIRDPIYDYHRFFTVQNPRDGFVWHVIDRGVA